MSLPVVFGAARKVYARAVRLALEEKATSMTYSKARRCGRTIPAAGRA